MFTKVLECPECQQRFNYDHEGEIFPESITCPECGSEREYNRFAVLIFCNECRVKLKIPLDILFNPQLACPECGAAIQATAACQGDTAISTFEDSLELQSQQHTRMLQDGEIFDKFQIIRLLGSGGMAEVYLAEHLLLKKQCAVKLMRNSGGNANGAVSGKRFVREAQLSHQIDHPNIVKVFDVGCDSQTGYLFIAMEYVEGPTLNDLLMERQLTEEELFDILKAMANALNALIESRVVHRDIKPSNIMVGKDGVYKLMDLGIAKSENNYNAGDMTLTLDQSSIGTPNYASPEQCRSAHTADFRSDIYSLGATLYHLASGRLPFTGATPVETILNVMQTEAVPLQEYRSDLSDKFINLLKKMMQKNPLDRPQTPDAILAEIYRNDESSSEEEFPVVEAEDAGEAERSWISRMIIPANLSFAQRIKRIAILLLVVLGALFVIYKINKPWISIYNWLNNSSHSTAKTVTRPAPVKYHFGTFAGKMHRLARHKESLQIKGGKRLYPLVKITPAPRENLKMCFDSSRMMTDYKGVINGKVNSGAHLAFAENEFVLEKSADVNKHIGLTFRDFSAKEFTLSLDLCIFNASNGCILRMNDIQILFEQRVIKLTAGGYYTSTNLPIPQNRWFNLTLVLSDNARKLTLCSGNRMVGSWHVPEHSLNGKFNAVDFFTFPPLQDKNDQLDQLPTAELNRVMRKFTGSISRLYLWDKAAGVNMLSAPDYQELQTADSANTLPDVWFTTKTADQTVPEVQAAETADQTAPQAENSTGTAAAQNPEGSLNWRLQFCINELQKAPNTSRTDYLKKQIAALEKQIQYRKNIDSAKAQYSADYGKEFTYLLNNFYNIPLHSEQKKGVESRLFDSLKMQNCNPDIEVDGKPFPVHLADKMSRFSRLTEFQALLAEKYSDGDRVIKHYDQFAAKHWKNKFIQQWYKQGVEDIDNAKTFAYLKNNPQKIAPVNGFALSCIKYRQYGLKLVDFDDLKQLLLLAPRIDRKIDSDGKNLMHYAAECDDSDLAQILLDSNFTGSKDLDNNGNSPWQAALRSGSSGMVKFMQQNNLQFNEKSSDSLQFQFWQALYRLDTEGVKAALRKNANPYLQNKYGVNALQYACLRGNNAMVNLLLAENVKADVYIDSFEFDNNPLVIAINKGDFALFSQLLKHGATFQNVDGIKFKNIRYLLRKYNVGHYLVVTAIKNKWSFDVFKLFFDEVKSKNNIPVNSRFFGYSMLWLACSYDNTTNNLSGTRRRIVKYLMQKGSKIHFDYHRLQPYMDDLKVIERNIQDTSESASTSVSPAPPMPIQPRRSRRSNQNWQNNGAETMTVELKFRAVREVRFRLRNGKLDSPNNLSNQQYEIKTPNSIRIVPLRDPVILAAPEKYLRIADVEVLGCNREAVDVIYDRKVRKNCRVVWNESGFEAVDDHSGTAVFHLKLTLTNDPAAVNRFSKRSTFHRKLPNP